MGISLSEKLLTLAEAQAILPGRPSLNCIWRWYARGVRGCRLETVVIGGRRFTSESALTRFMAATTVAADGAMAHKPGPSADRQRQIQAAEHRLQSAGF